MTDATGPAPTDPIPLDQLPIMREIGAMLRASAAIEDAHDAQRAKHWYVRWLDRVLQAIGTPYRAVGTGAVVGVLVATVLVSAGYRSDTPGLTAVASASAALSPPGQVVHLVLRGGAVQTDGTPVSFRLKEHGTVVGRLGRRVERWSTTNPMRVRANTQVRTPDGERSLGLLEHGQAKDGTNWEAKSWESGIRRRDSNTSAAHANPMSIASPLTTISTDPATAVQRLLHADRFADRGEATVDGHAAKRLVADVAAGSGPGGRRTPATRVEYFVDAKTFEPLEIRQYLQAPARIDPGRRQTTSKQAPPGRYGLVRKWRIERYERLPLSRVDPTIFEVPSNKQSAG